MARCAECGGTIKAASKCCEYCGARVDVSELESVLSFHEDRHRREQEAAKAAREAEAERERYRDAQFWKATLLMIVVGLVLLGAGAWNEHQAKRGTTEMPVASSELKGDNYQDVQTNLQAAGFTNLETTAVPDLVVGWVHREGEVKEVSVNGETEWSVDSRFPTDAKIVIRFHTFRNTN